MQTVENLLYVSPCQSNCRLLCNAMTAHLTQGIAVAECTGGVIAGLLAGPLYGVGSGWLKRLLPWIKPTEVITGENNTNLVDLEAIRSSKNNSRSESDQTEMYDTNNTDSGITPLYANKPRSGFKDSTPNSQDGVSTIV